MSNHNIAPGDRVGAISHADDNAVYLFGYGVYEGEFVPENMASEIGKVLQSENVPNPRIKLDSGQTVYGCECWWATEDHIKTTIGTREIVSVDIDAVRASIKEGTDYVPDQTVETLQDPELTEIVHAAEVQFPTLEAVKHDIETLLNKYIAVKLEHIVPKASQDLLLELAAMQKEGVIKEVTRFSLDIDDDELEVNLGIRFPNDFIVGIIFVVGPKMEKSNVLDATEN